eukprot:scaffold297_cov164-Ochromonas_danica.AAC.9
MSRDENWEDILAIRQRARIAERLQIEANRIQQMKLDKQTGLHLTTTTTTTAPSTKSNTLLSASTKAEKLRLEIQQARNNSNNQQQGDREEEDQMETTRVNNNTDLASDEKAGNRIYGKSYDLAHVENKMLMENFNRMMTYYYGHDKERKDAIVKEKMRKLAQEDADQEEIRRQLREKAQQRLDAARKIEKWYRDCRATRLFRSFMSVVSDTISHTRSLQSSLQSTRKKGSRQQHSRSRQQTPNNTTTTTTTTS